MLNEKLKMEILAHSKSQYPKESCGLLIKKHNDVKYISCNNVADDPTETFIIAHEDIFNIPPDYDIVGIVHSHVNGRNYLSKYDLQYQRSTNLDWYLVCGNKITKYRKIEKLLGRTFEFNKQDCYNLFQDCYMLSGIDFPNFRYVENWYDLGQNLYVDNLIKYGFEKVTQPELGDVILFQVGSDIANHCGVYLGNGYFIHHSINQLSKRDLFGGYWLKHCHSIWRYKWKCQLNFMAILESLEIPLN